MNVSNRMAIPVVRYVQLSESDISPLISKCEIKVLYTGKNRNRSWIEEDVATKMAKTLRGNPIVGYWKKPIEDFGDHGQRIVINDEGVEYECLTVPYGFVDLNAKVWFEDFTEVDEFGNEVVRTYLVTEGYLWTGQFDYIKDAVKEGRPQSMELDSETLEGTWTKAEKENNEFFIINDAIFSKLCILGEDVEPCFEGASVVLTEEENTYFTKVDDDLTKTLYTLYEELMHRVGALEEGGQQMADELIVEETVETEVIETETEVEAPIEEETPVVEESFAAKKDEEEESSDEESSDEEEEEKKKKDEYECEDEDDKKKSYELETELNALKEEHASLQEKYSALEEEVAGLRTYKANIESNEKDNLIKKFSLKLSKEKIDEFTSNKDSYSLHDLKRELSLAYAESNGVFEDNEEVEVENTIPVTYSLTDNGNSNSALVEMLKQVRDSRE